MVRKWTMKILLSAFFVVTLLLSCGDNLKREDLIELYFSNHGHGDEKLELLANGTYTLTYTKNGAIVFKNENSWIVEDYKDGTPGLTFKGFIFGYRDSFPTWGNIPGYWYVKVEKSWLGEIRLRTDADLSYYYVKK